VGARTRATGGRPRPSLPNDRAPHAAMASALPDTTDVSVPSDVFRHSGAPSSDAITTESTLVYPVGVLGAAPASFG